MKTNFVIDGENQIKLESFDPKDSIEIKEKYENMNKWGDVDFDCDGDLILWED